MSPEATSLGVTGYCPPGADPWPGRAGACHPLCVLLPPCSARARWGCERGRDHGGRGWPGVFVQQEGPGKLAALGWRPRQDSPVEPGPFSLYCLLPGLKERLAGFCRGCKSSRKFHEKNKARGLWRAVCPAKGTGLWRRTKPSCTASRGPRALLQKVGRLSGQAAWGGVHRDGRPGRARPECLQARLPPSLPCAPTGPAGWPGHRCPLDAGEETQTPGSHLSCGVTRDREAASEPGILSSRVFSRSVACF